jgi:hypothetical protein
MTDNSKKSKLQDESFAERLVSLISPGPNGSDVRATNTPEAWRPRMEIDESGGFVVSKPRPAGEIPDAADILKEFDLDPTGPFDNLTIRMVAGKKVKTENGMKSLGSLFFKEHKKAKFLSDEPGQTLPSLVKTGFKINKENWSSDEGYYVDKCTQEGCAQYTYDMIGDKFGDAWQAYRSFGAYLNVSSSTVKKMEVLFI